MTEQNLTPEDDAEDTEGHVRFDVEEDEGGDDTEGHSLRHD